MNEAKITAHVAKLVDACETHLADVSVERERALNYYNGEMPDMMPDEGRSGVVSKDVRSTIKKLMPSIMRSIMSNDKIVDYEPVGQEGADASRARPAAHCRANMVQLLRSTHCPPQSRQTPALVPLFMRLGVNALGVARRHRSANSERGHSQQNAPARSTLYGAARLMWRKADRVACWRMAI